MEIIKIIYFKFTLFCLFVIVPFALKGNFDKNLTDGQVLNVLEFIVIFILNSSMKEYNIPMIQLSQRI